jgi:hypothetical protein
MGWCMYCSSRVSTEFPNDVTFLALAPQNILISYESLEANRSPRVDPSRADTELGTGARAKAVRASRVIAMHERAAG